MIEGGFVMIVCAILLSIAGPAERTLRRHQRGDLAIGQQLRDAFPLADDDAGLVRLAHDADQALAAR